MNDTPKKRGRKAQTHDDYYIQRNGKYLQVVWKNFKKNGRPIVESLGRADQYTKSSLAAKIVELRRKHDGGTVVAGKAPTLAAWLQTVEKRRKTSLSKDSFIIHRFVADSLLAYFNDGDVRIDRITRTDAADWRAGMTSKAGKTLKPTSKLRYAVTAQYIFQMAVEDTILADNPFTKPKIRLNRKAKKQGYIPTEDEVTRLVDAAGRFPNPVYRHRFGKMVQIKDPPVAPEWKALIALCAYAGMRLGETMLLCWRDVKWTANRLSVQEPKDTKGERSEDTHHARRDCLLEPVLADILRQAREDMKAEGVPTGDKDPICPIVYDRANIRRRIRSIMVAAGLTPWQEPTRALRRWRASTWRLKYPADYVNTWLGHSQEVAMIHYVQPPESVYEAVTGKRKPARKNAAAKRIAELEAKLAAAGIAL